MSDDKLWDNAFSHAEAVIGLSRSDNVGGLVAKWRAEADINAPRLLHPEACEAKRECADELEATLSAHGGLLFTQGDMERFAGYVADAREERLKSAHGQPVVDGRYFADGPQGWFVTDNLELARALVSAYDKNDDWTVTDIGYVAGALG